jgi:hypothetical protein
MVWPASGMAYHYGHILVAAPDLSECLSMQLLSVASCAVATMPSQESTCA